MNRIAPILIAALLLVPALGWGQEVNPNRAPEGLVSQSVWDDLDLTVRVSVLQEERSRKGFAPIPEAFSVTWNQLSELDRVTALLYLRGEQGVADAPEAQPQPVVNRLQMSPEIDAAVRLRALSESGMLLESPHVMTAQKPPGNLRNVVLRDRGRGDTSYYAVMIVTNTTPGLTPVSTDTWLRVDLSSACYKATDAQERDGCLKSLGPQSFRWVPVVRQEEVRYLTPGVGEGWVYFVRLSGSPDAVRGLDVECVERWSTQQLRNGSTAGEQACRFYPDAVRRSVGAVEYLSPLLLTPPTPQGRTAVLP